MVQEKKEILVVLHCTVAGENDDLLGVDETPIVEINWAAIETLENKVSWILHDLLVYSFGYKKAGVFTVWIKGNTSSVDVSKWYATKVLKLPKLTHVFPLEK